VRTRLRRRRERERAKAERGVFCEERMYSGAYYGARCIFHATGYQAFNDIYVCGIHARAYLRVEPLPSPKVPR
jgi:hypothetical protein